MAWKAVKARTPISTPASSDLVDNDSRAGARSIGGPPAEGGFTLLELAVVLFIMGLALTMVTPYFRGFRGTLLKNEVRRLAGRVSYLYETASAQKVVMRLTFDLDGNRYFVSRLDPYAPMPVFVADRQPGAAPVMLPMGVRLRDVTVENSGTLSRGTISCHFYPEGYVDATVIHLTDEWGDVFTVSLDPLTGRVAIWRGETNPGLRRRAAQ